MKPIRGVGRFARHQSANVAIIFAGCIFFIMSVVGFAIDHNMHRSAQAHVQKALDASGLAAMKYYVADPNISDDDLETAARDFFNEHVTRLEYASLDPLTLVRVGDTATLEVNGQMPTSIMQLFGTDTLGLQAQSEITFRDVQNVELALVLDTSHSMNGTKLTALQSAANEMVDQLVDPTSTQIKMSIVPFSGFVNVGTTHSDESQWLDIEPDRTETSSGENCVTDEDWAKDNCTPVTYDCGQDGADDTCERYDCSGKDIPEDMRTCTTYSTSQSLTWHGCVRSRPDPHYKTDTMYGTHKVPGIVTPSEETCAPQMQTLTNSDTVLHGAVGALEARGETYIPAGLVWGWRTLTNPLPFTHGEPTATFVNSGNIKAVILMSDGENSISALSDGTHEGNSQHDADTLTKAICTKIKNGKIDIYTIAFEVSDPATKDMLEECASSGSNYYEASNADQLTDAFESIRHEIESALAISG
ncbi:MAG: TadE/TadG family type IV pilus assembly protein [Pseudomonadota bacterium]